LKARSLKRDCCSSSRISNRQGKRTDVERTDVE
jgi:hypothetical protein